MKYKYILETTEINLKGFNTKKELNLYIDSIKQEDRPNIKVMSQKEFKYEYGEEYNERG
jgi:hypothetical protein